jgi:RNA polymerase sigma-70 factor, ECF subfamily
MGSRDTDIERALAGWRQGDQDAVDELFRLVYDELRVLAGRHLRRRRPGDTLGPTALVHEIYLRFAQRSSPDLVDRNHFVALAARAMRMVIVDHWRRRQSLKRGAQAPVSACAEDVAVPDALPAIDILALARRCSDCRSSTPDRRRSWNCDSSVACRSMRLAPCSASLNER